MSQASRLPASYRLVTRDTVGSTNDVARELAEAGAADGTVVWARRQTAGRGRLGRTFESPPGNLYASFVLRPDVRPAAAPQLSFVAALAVAETVAGVLPARAPVTVKWPNDVLVGARKVAGILPEAATAPGGTLDFVVLGIGINVASHPSNTRYGATDLGAAGATDAAVPDLLERLAARVYAWDGNWRVRGFPAVRAAWLKRAHGLGGAIDVAVGKTLISGNFVDLDGDGALIVAGAGGRRHRITAGDVVSAALQA